MLTQRGTSAPRVFLTAAVGTAAVMVVAPVAIAAAREPVVLPETRHVGEAPSTDVNWGFRALYSATMFSELGKWTAASIVGPAILSVEQMGKLMSRIESLRALDDGWLGAGSLAPSPNVLSWLSAHKALLARSDHTISLVPAADGSVELQWVADAHEYIAEIRADNTLYLYVDHTGTDEFTDATTSLTADALSAFIATGSVA